VSLPDLWGDCYTPEHRKLGNAEEFRITFCDKCVNPGCQNSAAAGTKWSRRMASQEENLLTNPRFADPRDPNFADIRSVEWENAIRQALAIEVSTRKGDWSVATESEIGQAAAEMIGIVPPSFITPEPDPPEPVEEEPEERPLTAKEVILLMRDARSLEELQGILPEGETRKSVLRVFESRKKALAEPDPPTEDIEGKWKVRGDTKKDGGFSVYEVTLYGSGKWECTCPSRQNPCKHAIDLSMRMNNAPPEAPVETPPPAPKPPKAPPARFRPTRNTAQPDEGIMVGGGPAPPSSDSWEPKKKTPKDRIIGVGGTVKFGSKD